MSGKQASPGSKSCRRASAARLFCVGEGEAAGDCFERDKGEFGFEELPQGEHRDIVLRGEDARGRRQEIVLSGRRGSSGPKAAAGRAPGDCSAWGGEEGEVAGYLL